MIIFWFCLTIIFIISLIFFILCLSSLQFEIEKLEFNSSNVKGEKIETYILCIRLKLFNKITCFKIVIDHEKMYKIKESKIFNDMNLRKLNVFKNMENILLENRKKTISKENLKIFNELNIQIEKIDLYIQIGAIDVFLTSFAVTALSTIISILLSKRMSKYNSEKCKYAVYPEYNSNPFIKIKLNCIINIKIVHIINVIYQLKKKRSVKYDERTSDRRSYVCSND